MGTELRKVSLQDGNQNLTCLEEGRNWMHEHSAITKILKIAGLILGIGLLVSSPFAIPLGISIVAGLAVTGITAIVASCLVHKAVKLSILPVTSLWAQLGQKTQAQLQGLGFLSAADLNHRFSDIRCPRKTAVSVAGQYLHANKLGEGIAQRSFVASQAPLAEDYEIFWKAVFQSNPIIFDLTTGKDQVNGGLTKYYPDQLNETRKYGSMSVKLIEVSGRTYTYQIENTETGAVKNIKRFHYADWKDFSAISLPALHVLVQAVESLSPHTKDLLWIHCRAGVGRTGSLITALVLKEKIERGEINKENVDASLVDIIVEFRKQRGPAFVQQKDQLDLLRQYADSLLAL